MQVVFHLMWCQLKNVTNVIVRSSQPKISLSKNIQFFEDKTQ